MRQPTLRRGFRLWRGNSTGHSGGGHSRPPPAPNCNRQRPMGTHTRGLAKPNSSRAVHSALAMHIAGPHSYGNFCCPARCAGAGKPLQPPGLQCHPYAIPYRHANAGHANAHSGVRLKMSRRVDYTCFDGESARRGMASCHITVINCHVPVRHCLT